MGRSVQQNEAAIACWGEVLTRFGGITPTKRPKHEGGVTNRRHPGSAKEEATSQILRYLVAIYKERHYAATSDCLPGAQA
jgi:hypothetical protein